MAVDRAGRRTGAPGLAEAYKAQKGNFLGVGLSPLGRDELVAAVAEAVRTRSRLTISFLNADYARKGVRNPDLRAKMNAFDIMLSDGWGVVWGARFLGIPVPERAANDDIGGPLFELSAKHGYKNFLFGSAPGIAERAARTLARHFPTLPLAGTLHGWFDALRGHPGWYEEEDNEMILRRINDADPDILWVGLPTPLQQNWVWENSERIRATVIITGGSYLDHLAERLNWYPEWINQLRLSWLYRLWREPRRLWKRYSIDLVEFLWLLVKEKSRSSK